MSLKNVIESILFVHGDPLSAEKLAKICHAQKEDIRTTLEELRKEFADRGLVILEKDGAWQFGTNPENSKMLEDLAKGEFSEELTKAALETITIVAYKGPLTRAQIEFVRGVNSSFILRNLLLRGLVERIDNPQDARSYLYRISFDFLKHFGLTKVEDLPNYEEFKKEKIDILDRPSA
ncbi:MAG: SMC-Scp complex subunit ScpB [Candidatus Sungbacteria bacterium]|nr:SMC-Scp complex subunit ScpB [Candidatus Sungbacteria bacterium]